ncbi:MAG: hypothetical protein ACR2QF_10525 [Geminicoccaceae bacterium]
MPVIAHPWWLLVPLLALLMIGLGRRHVDLPGAWHRAIEPGLQGLLAGTVEHVRRRSTLLALMALWLLLAACLATISFGQTTVPALRNLYARVVIIDLGLGEESADRVAAARYLIDDDKNVPTAVVAVTERAFDVVPLTRDYAHLDRYLQVLSSDVMPVKGRSLLRGVERAVALLDRAGIQARQIVVFTDGPPPAIGRFLKPENPSFQNVWLIRPGEGGDEWRQFGTRIEASLATDRETSLIQDDLEARRDAAAAKAVSIRERRDLTPWLIAFVLPLWLLVFFRRQTD